MDDPICNDVVTTLRKVTHVYLAADHQGAHLVPMLHSYITECFEDVTVHLPWTSTPGDDYPWVTFSIAKEMQNDPDSRGILLCGSGIGVAMAANRYPFLRAVVAYTTAEVKLAREHQDANVLCLSTWYIQPQLMQNIVKAFLKEPFEGGRHARRVFQMTYLHENL